jgi:hypothetical protein
MRRNHLAVAAAVLLSLSAAASARADIITFESGFVDVQAVGTVFTASNAVTFSVTGGGPGFIAQVGAPVTAFAVLDTPANLGISGQFFLTDETNGPSAARNYFMTFAQAISSLEFDLYDFRGDGGPNNDLATLTVYGNANFTNPLGTFSLPPDLLAPDGNIQHFLLANFGSARSASLTFQFGDVGTGIDNIQFENVPEPTTLALCGLIGAGFVGHRLRRRKLAIA